MTKADLIEEVSRVVEMTRKESEVIVEAIFDSIVRSLRAGDKIEIRGFGSFRTRLRQPRIGRNPKTGARVEVPAKKIPYFKAEQGTERCSEQFRRCSDFRLRFRRARADALAAVSVNPDATKEAKSSRVPSYPS
jgi:integration host factor subunit beta